MVLFLTLSFLYPTKCCFCLNIVKNLVDLHGATINATNNTEQKGANVEIIFPKSQT